MNPHRAVLLIASLAAFLTSARAEGVASTLQDESTAEEDGNSIDYRLPTTMHPTAYEIDLYPKLSGNFSFSASTRINVVVDKPTKSIVLHVGKITIVKVNVLLQDKLLEIERTNLHEKTEKYRIDLITNLNKGDEILVEFDYEGQLRDDMIGFYRSSYINSNGELKWLASTQFQTTHARHAFPCFDEPSFKASFTITMIVSSYQTAISNMPIEKIINSTSELKTVTFKKSVPMSTYLVAFAIFDFEFLKGRHVSVWARPNAKSQLSYALKIGDETLNLLADFFKQSYALPKLDMIAVPDFAAGAMENWGMVTYRESRMLYDEKESNVVSQQNVASVIVHELTHMWFGNLLTPSWWSYLWLSEGFARYFQYFGTAMVETDWNMEAQFLVEQHQNALAVDGIETSKSMTRDVKTPSDLGSIGDSITYDKGASVIRMMSHIVKPDKFYEALRVYIRDSKEKGIVEPKNLWEALQSIESLKINVETVMNSWTEQPGFPVLLVKIEKGKAKLRQQRFLLRNLKNTLINKTWDIPITYTTKKNTDFSTIEVKDWMAKDEHTIDVDVSDSDWVVFNLQQTGFYRVNYDRDSWYRIINTLNSTNYDKIHVYNRAGIVDDLLNLARAGLLDYQVALDGLQYLRLEKNYLPFKAAFRAFDYLTQRFSGNELNYTLYKNYVLSLIENVYEDLGYEDNKTDDRLTVRLRQDLNSLACYFGHKKCVATSLKYFRRWRQDSAYRIEPNQRPIAYCMGILYGDHEDWNYLWNHYQSSNMADEQLVVLNALGCSNDTDILNKYLLYAISPYEENKIRKQDSQSMFKSVYSSSLIGANFVLDFIDQNHAAMAKYYGDYGAIGSILSSASKYFSTQELVKKFEDVIEKLSNFSDIQNSLKNSLEIAKYELSWYEEYEEDIVSWINNNGKSPGAEDTTEYRLPDDVVPQKYTLSLEPFFNNFTFYGKVEIIAQVNKKTNKIVLHASELKIHGIAVLINNDDPIDVTWSIVEKYDFLVIKLGHTLNVKTAVSIGIQFSGKLNKEMRGFYRSSYIDKNGNKRWLAASHLEPTGARKMFPCFDEPAMKAVFTVNVMIPDDYHAISNMKISEIENYPENSKKWYRFEDTKEMSTYLLALVVSDFKSQTSMEADRNYTVWARPDAIDQASYALSLMEPLVTTYEKLFLYKYPLNKLDMIALPDFVSGAMENWGLLTFKESRMLWEETQSSTQAKKSVTNTISHEIAHQWFGDLVSPRWWNCLWLNEGFARYFQYFATSHIKDTWELESQFVVDQVHSAFEADALTSSGPMTRDVYSPTEIKKMFDKISYAKSASVIRMIEKTFGSTVFYNALNEYLEARKFNVATPENLYAALSSQINDTTLKGRIYNILDSWTTQAGYPIIHVTSNNYDELVFSQERFLLRNEKGESIEKTWHVPITWTTEADHDFENTKPQYWLSSSQGRVYVSKVWYWIIVNVQQAGYYRVNYDKVNWNRIIDTLKSRNFETIAVVNRAALMDDLMNLARAGYVDYDLLFSATEYLKREQHYVPWQAFFNGLKYLDYTFDGRDIYKYFKQHVKEIMTPIVRKLIDNGEPDKVNTLHTSQLLRMNLLEWSCKYDIGDCFDDMVGTSPDDKPSLYCSWAKTTRMWPILWSSYHKESTSLQKKLVILKALGCTENSENLNTLLKAAVTEDSGIRYQDSTQVFSSVYGSSLVGTKFVISFIKSNLKMMSDYYEDSSQISAIMSGLAKRISTEELHTKYKELSDTITNEMPMLKESMRSYNDLISYQHEWYKRKIPMISYWLETRYHDQDYRLPKALRPLHYNLTVDLEKAIDNFMGSVTIDIEVVEQTSQIVLNSRELEVVKVRVFETDNEPSTDSGKLLHILGYQLYPKSEKLIIYLDSYIEVPKITVDILYRGKINDHPRGLYRGVYYDTSSNRNEYLITYFQPNYARMAFPCFDEPEFKAKFQLTVRRSRVVNSVSNMPLERNLFSSTYAVDIYKESPIMSTYLVAFVLFNFNPIRNDKEMFNVWGRKYIVDKGASAQYTAFKCYESLQSLVVEQKNVLVKVDLVGVPNFPITAMENWGLIILQESAIFYDEDSTPLSHKNFLLTTIANQIAHTYFGNLVTSEWWSYVWLKEGLARYFQWLLIENAMDEVYFSDLFVVNDMHDVMAFDGTRFTRPLNYPVFVPDNLKKMLDDISSKKAASLMRMIHRTFGGYVFYSGIKDYVLENQYKTANPKKLWDAFQSKLPTERNVSVEQLMSTWTNNFGYPFVRVSRNSTGVIKFSQILFTYQGTKESNFHIPISIASELHPNFEDTSPKFWLTSEDDEIQTNLVDQWFIINVQQAGYYRVLYDNYSLQKIIQLLNSNDFGLIHVINRAQIIDDLFNLARIQEVSYENVFKAALYLRQEQEHLPWKAFERGITYLWENFNARDSKNRDILQRFVWHITKPHVKRLGFEDENNSNVWQVEVRRNQLNRETILGLSCKFGYRDCIDKALSVFKQNPILEYIPRNTKRAVLCTMMEHGSGGYQNLTTAYARTNVRSEKLLYLDALGCTENQSLLRNYLRTIFDKDKNLHIYEDDIPRAFASIYKFSRVGWKLCYDYITNNYLHIYNIFGDWDPVAKLFVDVIVRIPDIETADRFQFFMKNNQNGLKPIINELDQARREAINAMNEARYQIPGIIYYVTEILKDVENNPNNSTMTTSSTILLILSALFLILNR